jgi:hypothetical protein
MASGFISGVVKVDGKDGWNPTCSTFPADCPDYARFLITNVPSARDGSVIAFSINRNDFGWDFAVPICAVTDVYTVGFELECSEMPTNGDYLDYIVINRAGIQP